jgi:hypothetical protein
MMFKAIRNFELDRSWLYGTPFEPDIVFIHEGTIFEIPDSSKIKQEQVVERELAIIWKHDKSKETESKEVTE